MKNGILAAIVLMVCSWSASARDSEPLFEKNAVPKIVGIEFHYPCKIANIEKTSKDGVDYILTASYGANVFYERGSRFRFKFETGATMVSGPGENDVTRTVPAVGGTIMLGYPFVGFQQRTYVLGYLGVGIAAAPYFGLLGKGVFEFKLSHYFTNMLALNVMLRSVSYVNHVEGYRDIPVSVGVGFSYML